MSFDEIFDLTAGGVYLYCYNINKYNICHSEGRQLPGVYDLHDLDHVAGCEPYDLRDLAHVFAGLDMCYKRSCTRHTR